MMKSTSSDRQDPAEMIGNRQHRDHISLRVPGDDQQQFLLDPYHNPLARCNKDFLFYTMDLSYFSGKLEMYFRYKELQHERLEVHGREFETILYKNSGSEQVPQVFDNRDGIPDNKRWLRDTTPIIEHLEADAKINATGVKSMLPSCPLQRYFQFLVEDFADEFLWRPAMWWRWEPEFDRFIMGHRFTYEFARTTQSRFFFPLWMRPSVLSFRQWLLSCYGEDVTTDSKKQLIKNQYYELLSILEEILLQHPYLFGNHPTLADFGFAGPFFRHFSSDFSARKVMQNVAPNVYEWMARLWNCKSSKLDKIDSGFPSAGTLPASWHRLLNLLAEYLHYYHLNAVAFRDKKPNFQWVYRGETFLVPTVPYRVWCRKQLQLKFNQLDKKTQSAVESILRQRNNCWDLLWADGVIDIPPELGTEPPFVLHPPPKTREGILAYKWDADPVLFRFLKSYFLPPATLFTAVTVAGILAWKFKFLPKFK
jgi:glutathione S-transferase